MKEQTQNKLTELEEWKKKAEEYLAGWKRAKADFVNREREFDRQREGLLSFTMANCVLVLLPAYEAFVKACREMPRDVQSTEWGKGIAHVAKNFEKALSELGVGKMETLRKPFDPLLHEAVGKRKEEGVAPGTIVEEVRPGYFLKKNVLLHAKVIVAE